MESTNLVELVKNAFNQDTLNHAASQLQEGKGNIEKALDGIIPAVLLRLEAKASFPSKTNVLKSLHEASLEAIGEENGLSEGIKNSLTKASDPNGIEEMEKSDGILKELFTDRLGRVNEAVVQYSGLKPSSVLRLFGVVAPATILSLYSHYHEDIQVMDQLVNQKPDIIEQIPSGLSLKEPLGIDKMSNVDEHPVIPRESDDAQQRQQHKVSIIQWIIILILGLGILFGFYAGCGSNNFGVTNHLPADPTPTTQPANK